MKRIDSMPLGRLARRWLVLPLAVLLMSCGGGGGGGGGFYAPVGGSPAATTPDVQGNAGGGNEGPGNAAPSSGSDGGTGVAAGPGEGDGDAGGVGSGGTGVSTADAVGVGAVDGFGSVVVDGLRYATDDAQLELRDATELRLGMTVRVTGPLRKDFSGGIAKRIESAVDLRGTVASVDRAGGSLVIEGTRVETGSWTVWGDAAGLDAIQPGAVLQVWGLPGAAGTLRATRVESAADATPVLTGTVQSLDGGGALLTLAGRTIDLTRVLLTGLLDPALLRQGQVVRVRTVPGGLLGGVLGASSIEAWNPLTNGDGVAAHLAGVVSDFDGAGSFKIAGTAVDVAGAKRVGNPQLALGNGASVVVDGRFAGGVLRVERLRVRDGADTTSAFTLDGTIGDYTSSARFRLRGQVVDASGASFTGGTAAGLGNGVKVSISGSRVQGGVLIAERVVFR